jgi:Flp pilus assembly protein TadD
MRHWRGIFVFLTAAGGLAQAAPPEPILVNSRAVVLSFSVGGAGGIDDAQVWVRADRSVAWTEVESVRVGTSAVRFKTTHDGRYECYLSLRNSAGRSAPPPCEESEPHAIIVVDTAPPTLQIHRTYAIASDNLAPLLRLDVTLSEENLGAGGLRLFFRNTSGDEWRDGGVVTCGGGMIEWSPPRDVAEVIDVRLVATDLAGNRSMEEAQGVRTRSRAENPENHASTQPSIDVSAQIAAGMVPTSQPEDWMESGPPPAKIETSDESSAATRPSEPAKVDPRAAALRRQAARFLAEGRLELAGARLRDALELAPNDPDINSELGTVLFRTGRNAESVSRFQLALKIDPNHEAALEGLALTEFTQRRYSDARDQLRRLLQLRPENGEYWLRYGDVEHLLGNRRQATAAWEKAMALNTAGEDLRNRALKRVRELSGRFDAGK